MNNLQPNNKEITSARLLRTSQQELRNDLLVPKLRFKEFEGEWSKKRLNTINIKVIDGDRGKNYPNGNDFSNDGFCLFLNAKNVTKKGFSFAVTSFISKEKDLLLRKGKLKRFDIVLTTRGSVGHIAYYNESIHFENLRINSGMVLIRTDSKFVVSNYLNRYFRSNQIQNEIKKISFGSAQPQLTVGEIVKFKIAFPSLKEQQKIATFLTAVDTKIQQLGQKKELLANYKKGVMQQLFSQQLRFKPDSNKTGVIANDSEAISNSKNEQNSFPDWEEKRLGEIADIKRGAGSQYINYVNKESNSIRLIRIGDFLGNEPVFIKNTNDIKRFRISKDDILIAGTGATAGITFKVPNEFIDLAFSYNAPRIRAKKVKADFLIFYLKSDLILRQQRGLFTGNAQPFLDTKAINNFKLKIPSLKEQQKIANYLSAIDKKIETVQTQIDKTQAFKKGLLQQMFV
ncbi:restriction endonuclease subunit S [uncultured Polaribacter sp.]|uniref:restriction endonuclease subunit S n=1 Tax=uncultured Polaribacter sp. TaxID=174711 RepID=UPI0026075260|nr:restriction endonuclease subunit S [uncultured Polaribacter sp.]